MFHPGALRRRFSYANVAATLALVFAMGGTAIATTHYVINSTKQINPKVLKQLKGKAGPPGSPGTQGPAGQNGQTGLKGETGMKGETGTKGETGPKGETGTKGQTGPKGEAGLSALSTLPTGQSESGQVGVIGNNPVSGQQIEDTVTFPVPLPEPLPESHVIFTTTAGTSHCAGQGSAEKGYLCIYVVYKGNVGVTTAVNFERAPEHGAGLHGFAAFWSVTTTGAEAWAEGSWTVTAS